MPSDHAVLFALLAAGLWFQNRFIGCVAACCVMLLIWFPRVYLGIHWPSDILAGAFLGAALAWLARLPALQPGVQSFLIRDLTDRSRMLHLPPIWLGAAGEP